MPTSSGSLPAIPSLPEPDWAALTRVSIAGEASSLVPLSLAPRPLVTYPAYARLGIPGAVNECYVRPAVHRLLMQAARSLPQGMSLVVLDGWRPWRVQQVLFETLHEAIKAKHPGLDDTQLIARTREFVSLPTRDPAAPSPHLTGGAVDVTLCDADGRLLEMGTPFDAAVAASHTDHFERHSPRDGVQRRARDNRRLLYRVMRDAGFTNLPSEWWHFDYGDQLWAWYSGEASAPFGSADIESIETLWR